MTLLRIVELSTGEYAVQKKGILFWSNRKFCGISDDYVWNFPQFVEQYCLMKTLTEAEKSLEDITKQITDKRRFGKWKWRVTKVIKVVRV